MWARVHTMTAQELFKPLKFSEFSKSWVFNRITPSDLFVLPMKKMVQEGVRNTQRKQKPKTKLICLHWRVMPVDFRPEEYRLTWMKKKSNKSKAGYRCSSPMAFMNSPKDTAAWTSIRSNIKWAFRSRDSNQIHKDILTFTTAKLTPLTKSTKENCIWERW